MRIRIITVGKVSRPYRDIFEDYRKRLRREIQLEHVQLRTGGDLNRENPDLVKRREYKNIKERILGSGILLDRRGRMLDSLGFSRLISNRSVLTFVIGGPLGVPEEAFQEFEDVVSLSRLTFSHEIAFAVLLEQIFRSYKINRGERYHY